MKLTQHFNNFLTLLKFGESGSKATFNGAALLQAGDQVAVGSVEKFYLDASAVFADNQFLSPSPSNYPQESDSAAIASGTNGGIGFLERFVSGPLGRTDIPAGTWTFNTYCYASSLVGTNRVVTRINKRVMLDGTTGTFSGAGPTRTFTVTGGTPFVPGDATASILTAALIETPTQTAWISGYTSPSVVTVTLTDPAFVNVADVQLRAMYYLLFNTDAAAPDIISSSLAAPHAQSYSVVHAAFTGLTATDRLVAAYFAVTDQPVARTINLIHGGSINYSNIVTPLLGNLITQTLTDSTTSSPSEKTVKEALASKLGATANINTQTGTTYTILTSDLGKDVRFTSGTAVTLILSSYTGFEEGFQCTLHNDSASAIDVTFSGTLVCTGTKIAQKKSALLRMVGSSWRCSGGVS